MSQNAVHAVIDKCFGFDTAVEEAQRALMAAKVEGHISIQRHWPGQADGQAVWLHHYAGIHGLRCCSCC